MDLVASADGGAQVAACDLRQRSASEARMLTHTVRSSGWCSLVVLKVLASWSCCSAGTSSLPAAGALTGAGASVVARRGHFLSHRPILAATNRTAFGCEASFTLAFGGGGAAHGGRGGAPAPGDRDASWSYALGAAARDGAAFFRGGKNSILSSYANPAVAVDATTQ